MVEEGKGPWQINALIILLLFCKVGGLYIHLFPLCKARKVCFIYTLKKQVCLLCALIISQPMKHTISFMHYPFNQLSHISSNNVGHLELKNLSTHGEANCK